MKIWKILSSCFHNSNILSTPHKWKKRIRQPKEIAELWSKEIWVSTKMEVYNNPIRKCNADETKPRLLQKSVDKYSGLHAKNISYLKPFVLNSKHWSPSKAWTIMIAHWHGRQTFFMAWKGHCVILFAEFRVLNCKNS